MNITRSIKNTLGTAMLAGALMFAPQAAHARVFFSVGFAPPAIPYYAQPLCPGDGYIWTPGYWAYTDDGYVWVDGAWVLAPYEGALWTPGYWGWGGGFYRWYPGYWGRTVGYYGGINYGFGYFGTGFYGGYWGGGHFFYNRGYNNINIHNVHNVYERREAGFDGRPGGSSFSRDNGRFDANRGGSFNDRGNDFNRGGNFDRGNNAREASFSHGVQTYTGSATTANQARSSYGGFGATSNARESFNNRAVSPQANQPRSFAQPSRSYSQPSPQSFARPGNGGETRSFSAPSGGGGNFQRGGGGGFSGGGGFHGGGGGGRGGGHR